MRQINKKKEEVNIISKPDPRGCYIQMTESITYQIIHPTPRSLTLVRSERRSLHIDPRPFTGPVSRTAEPKYKAINTISIKPYSSLTHLVTLKEKD